MSKREIILVIAMVLGVMYGAWELFFAGGTPRQRAASAPAAAQPDLTAFVTETAARILPTEAEKGLKYAMARAAGDWPGNPFLDKAPELFDSRKAVEETLEKDKAPEVVFAEGMVYSGFLELGKVRLAIINGIEYQAGEMIEHADLKLAEIQPNRVVMVRQHDGQRLILPLNE